MIIVSMIVIMVTGIETNAVIIVVAIRVIRPGGTAVVGGVIQN